MIRIISKLPRAKICKASSVLARPFSGKAPDSFFDEGSELEKEMWDFKLAKANGGFLNLTMGPPGQACESLGKTFTIDDLQAMIEVRGAEDDGADEIDDDRAAQLERDYGIITPGRLPDHLNIASRAADNSISSYLPPEYSNHSMDWKDLNQDEEPEELESFTRRTDETTMPIDRRGLVACPGKRQRRGVNPILKCHLIDLDALHYTDIVTLRRFIAGDSEILGKKLTGLCSKCQRKVARNVKRARNLGILSHLGAFRVLDADPKHDADKFNFHRSPLEVEVKVSKTIL